MSLRKMLSIAGISAVCLAVSSAHADKDKQTPPMPQNPDLATKAPEDAAAVTAPNVPLEAPEPLTQSDTDTDTTIVLPNDILADSAGRYGSYQAVVSMYDRDFKSQDDIINASTDLGTHNAEHLASGWLAYSALLASQTAEFQSEVIKADAYFGRSQFLTIMNSEITYAMKLGGAQDALNNALDVSKADSRRLTRIGKSLSSQSGLPLQSLGWAKAKLRGNRNTYVRTLEELAIDGRPILEDVKTLFDVNSLNDAISKANTLGSKTSLWDNLLTACVDTEPEFKLPTFDGSGFTTFTPFPRRKKTYDFLNGRITTLAALHILDETHHASPELSRILTDKEIPGGVSLTSCLKQSQLQYFTCVEGNQFVYERAFCIGEFAVKNVGECIDKYAN